MGGLALLNENTCIIAPLSGASLSPKSLSPHTQQFSILVLILLTMMLHRLIRMAALKAQLALLVNIAALALAAPLSPQLRLTSLAAASSTDRLFLP